MPCFCFGITSDCSFGGYNAHQLDIKNVDDLILTDKWGRPSTFEKGIELMIASFRTKYGLSVRPSMIYPYKTILEMQNQEL